jgi:hypothetical protein
MLASGRLHAFQTIVQGLRLHDDGMTTAGADEIAKGDELIHQNLQ